MDEIIMNCRQDSELSVKSNGCCDEVALSFWKTHLAEPLLSIFMSMSKDNSFEEVPDKDTGEHEDALKAFVTIRGGKGSINSSFEGYPLPIVDLLMEAIDASRQSRLFDFESIAFDMHIQLISEFSDSSYDHLRDDLYFCLLYDRATLSYDSIVFDMHVLKLKDFGTPAWANVRDIGNDLENHGSDDDYGDFGSAYGSAGNDPYGHMGEDWEEMGFDSHEDYNAWSESN